MVKKEEGKKSLTKAELEEALINNFTNLQKVLTNLAVRFDELSSNMSKMLQLFEISAKSFAEKYSEGNITMTSQPDVDKEFLRKLDALLDQNKVISKGIMLMEEKIRERNNPAMPQREEAPAPYRRPIPRY
jgi:hypothetical protein